MDLVRILALLVVWPECRLKARARVVARVMRIHPCGIAKRRSDRDFARDRPGWHRDRRADIARRCDVALVYNPNRIVIAQYDVLHRSCDAAASDLFRGVKRWFGGVDEQ